MMADRADQVVIVADSSKLGQRAFARICVPERIDVLDTDSEVSEIAIARLAERGIRVITA
jgi:DeoR family transcriptional regulator of aga operon